MCRLSRAVLPAPAAGGCSEAARTSRTAVASAAGRGLLHPQLPAVDVLAVELRDRLIGFFRRRHLDEAEAARTARFTIGHDRSRFDLSGRREHFTKPFRRCGERETADEQFLRHGQLLCCFHAVSSCAPEGREWALESWPGATPRHTGYRSPSGEPDTSISYIRNKGYTSQ